MSVPLIGFIPAVPVPELTRAWFAECHPTAPAVSVTLHEAYDQAATVWRWKVVEHPSGDYLAAAVVFDGDTGQWEGKTYRGEGGPVMYWLNTIGVPAARVGGTPALNR